VMWGDGATSGVINIITRKDKVLGLQGSMGVVLESFGGTDGNANLRIGSDKSVIDMNVRSVASNGYRDNSKFTQDAASIGLNATEGAISIRARLSTEQSMNRFPAGLTYSQNLTNPRLTTTPNDWGNLKQNMLSVGIDYRLGAWTAILDMGNRVTESAFPSLGSTLATRNSNTLQATPKAVYRGDVGGVAMRATLGAEVQTWNFHGDNVPDASYAQVIRNGTQANHAWFAMTDWLFTTQTRVVAGYRRELISKSAQDIGGLNTMNSLNNKLSAAELSVNQTMNQGVDAYARVAKSYRLGVIEDFMVTNAGIPLRPQTSNDKEIGVKFRRNRQAFTARYFAQNTVDEIYLDPTTSKNINFDPTKRNGLELQVSTELSSAVRLSGTLQSMQATFASGIYAGKHIPLVNEQTATLRMGYRIDEKQSFESAWRMLGSTFAGSDEANTCGTKVPSSRMFDALYRWRDKGVELSFGANNLTNQKTYQYDYGCGSGGYVYPDPGRTLRAALKYNF